MQLPVMPEHKLWFAVLRLAISDANHHRNSDTSSLRWFESDLYAPGSFLWICDQLECSPHGIREALCTKQLTKASNKAHLFMQNGLPNPERVRER